MSSLFPSLNRKLRGKEYSSLAIAVEAAQIEEQCLGESERPTHREDQEQHGIWRELSGTKELPRKDLRKADQKVPGKLKVQSAKKLGKGCWNCGKEGHIQVQCPKQMTKPSKHLLQICEGQLPQDELPSKWQGSLPSIDQFWSK